PAPGAPAPAAMAPPPPPPPPPGWVPPGYQMPYQQPPYHQPRPVPKAPEPPPARLPGANQSAQRPQAVTGPLRYYHNPQHLMPERAIMGMMQAVAGVDQSLKGGQLPDYDPLRRIVDEVIDRLGSDVQKLSQGIEIRILNQPHDQSHPVNVFILSIAMGLAMNYDPEQLRTLGLAALCHDIGKSAIPPEILNKVGALTPHEVEMLRAHTLMGKRIMEKVSWASPLMARIVYEHHERNDGSGYPLRLQEHQIHEMSKIVAIAEVYDALISDTSYRGRFSPEVAYNSIRVGERTGLDAKAIRAFQRYIVPYPINSFVKLDTDEVGHVVAINRQNLFKPVIKIGAETVDLAAQSQRAIVTSHFQAY
ncbi:MAG: HD-GYP domain-containing protein, partial [Candidatus Sericytochromatia bacterium]